MGLPLDSSQLPGRLSIKLGEELVSQPLHFLELVAGTSAAADRVWLRWLPVTKLPLESACQKLHGWCLSMGLGRSEEAAVQYTAQCLDESFPIVGSNIRCRAPSFSIPQIPGELRPKVETPLSLSLPFAGTRQSKEFAGRNVVITVKRPRFPEALRHTLPQLPFFLWVEHSGVNRHFLAEVIEEYTDRLLTLFRLRCLQNGMNFPDLCIATKI